MKVLNEAGAYAAGAHNAHRYLLSFSLCESAREISGVRTIRPQPQQKGGSGQGNSFFLWPIVLPQFENTAQLFHLPLCTQRNRKCLHHRLHPSSPAKRPVTFIDFWLSLLSTSNMTDPRHYSRPYEHHHDNLPLLNWHIVHFLFPLLLIGHHGLIATWQVFESDLSEVLSLELNWSNLLRQA